MQANSLDHKLFHFQLFLWIWKAWNGKEKYKKAQYLENKNSFFDEIKNNFLWFWKGYPLVKK